MKQGVYAFGTINGISERPYDFTDDGGKQVSGITRKIRLFTGEQLDAFGESEKIYTEIRVPESEWGRLKARAIELQGQHVFIKVLPHSFVRGVAVVRATEASDFIEEGKSSSKAA